MRILLESITYLRLRYSRDCCREADSSARVGGAKICPVTVALSLAGGRGISSAALRHAPVPEISMMRIPPVRNASGARPWLATPTSVPVTQTVAVVRV